MEPYKITLLSLSALFAVYKTFKTSNRLANSIAILQVASVAFILLGNSQLQMLAFYMLFVSLILGTIYASKSKVMSMRVVLLLVVVPLFALYLFKAFHLQGIFMLGYSVLLSFGAFVYAAVKQKEFKDEIGFLAIMGTESFIRIMDLFIKST